jgi:hypothetical protein
MELNTVINYVINFFRGWEQTLGLPLWSVLTISAGCLILLFFYGLYVPISMIRMKNNLNDLIQFLSASRFKVKANS